LDEDTWGISTSIDIYNCHQQKIRDSIYIKQFVIDLCELIGMKRFGETQVIHFGENEKVAGFSMTQLIETSLISAHFANLTNTIYLDVFSCKTYSPVIVAKFSKLYFNGEHYLINTIHRK